LEFGIKFCMAFIFLLILLIKLKDKNKIFSDKLWNFVALLLFDEDGGGGTGFDASTLFYKKN